MSQQPNSLRRSNSLVIQKVAIEQLKPAIAPVRHHPKKEREKLRLSLEVFGAVRPPLVTSDLKIVDGELVWETLRDMGAVTIDVIVMGEELSPIELKALRTALNRIPLDARWNEQSLHTVLEEMVEVDFDLVLTGFDAPEIDTYLNLDLPDSNVEENGQDVPALQDQAITVPGDIWHLGDHRIGCGSALDVAFVHSVLGQAKADVCFVDPPYNIPVDGFISGKGKNRHREFVQGTGELSADAYQEFLRASLAVLKGSCSGAALIYACIDWRHIKELTIAGNLCDMPLHNICVWTKTNGGMGGVYRNQHELIAVFQAGPDTPLNNVELGRYGRNRTNVWTYPGMSSFGKDREALLGLHPTVKPLRLIADALRDVTKRGHTFLGSGSTLMAAQETGRVCCGIDLDPLYVDVAVRRWQNATGRDAMLVGSDERFNDRDPRLLLDPKETQHGKQ